MARISVQSVISEEANEVGYVLPVSLTSVSGKTLRKKGKPSTSKKVYKARKRKGGRR